MLTPHKKDPNFKSEKKRYLESLKDPYDNSFAFQEKPHYLRIGNHRMVKH